MGQDEDAIIQCKDLMKSIITKFPEAKPELKNMIGNVDKGEAVVLTNVQDLDSRLKLMKIFVHLRLAAVPRGNNMDKSYQITPKSVQLLRRRFAPLLGFTQDEIDGNDASSSDSDSSSSSSSVKKKKKSKKSKKDKKKKAKDKKKRKKDKKKKKKAKAKRGGSTSVSSHSEVEEKPEPVLVEAPSEPPAPERRVKGPEMPAELPVEDDDDFGPAQSYREVVGDEAFYANTGDDTIVAPVLRKEEETRKGRDEWMTMLPDSGTGPLGSIAWRHGRARGTDGSKAAVDRARNEWTMTPAEKAAGKRAREDDEEEEDEKLLKYQQFLRDQEANARARQQFEKANAGREKSLMEMHQEKMKKEGDQGGRWNKERDFDSAGMIDSKRLEDAVTNAGSGLASRFGHGSRHFLA